ncbi:hypothetical protein [Microbacterium sp. NPDC056569]|uniref:hypothetical protein n=1 Tax=Microbacterium sp. NPDC056569 TaxID=3345867 RepID=UPI0036733B2E
MAVRPWLPTLVLVAALTGCAGGGPPPGTTTPVPEPAPSEPSPAATVAAPVPWFIGPTEDGRAFEMTIGQTTTLRLTDPQAAEPEAIGTAVLLIPVTNVTAAGVREWEVRGVEPGTAVVRSTGEPPWEVTLTVAAE